MWNLSIPKSAPKILEFGRLNPINPGRLQSWHAFSIKYRDAKVYNITAMRWIETTTTNFPLRNVFEQRWDERTDPFWWSAIAYKALESKRVVRSHAARKLRIAFTESLKKKGFAPDGNVLAGTFGGPLTGTAQLTPKEVILKTRPDALILETDAALEAILKQQGRAQSKKAAGAGEWQQKPRNTFRNAPKSNPGTTQGFTITRKRM